MRVLFVLCALLAIAVTSLARPKDINNGNEKTTTAVPLVTATKNDSLVTTPASFEKSNEKLASIIAHTTPSVNIADNQKDRSTSTVTHVNKSDVATSNFKNDITTAIAPTEKIVPTIKPTTTVNPSTVTTTIVTTTDATTTASPPMSTCTPLPAGHFDGLSFLGGIILTVCLIGVGVFLCKYCQHIHEDKYRTL